MTKEIAEILTENDKLFREQITETLARYYKIDESEVDGSLVEVLLTIVR